MALANKRNAPADGTSSALVANKKQRTDGQVTIASQSKKLDAVCTHTRCHS